MLYPIYVPDAFSVSACIQVLLRHLYLPSFSPMRGDHISNQLLLCPSNIEYKQSTNQVART